MSEVKLDDVIHAYNEYFQVYDDKLVATVMCTILSSQLKIDPVWVLIVGPSGSGKTELVRPLEGSKITHFTSSLTPNAMISAYKKHKDDKENYSLIPRIKNKCLVIKDMTILSQLGKEIKSKIIGDLRDAYDGFSGKESGLGSHKARGYFSLLGISTTHIEDDRDILSLTGERFLFYYPKLKSTREAMENTLNTSTVELKEHRKKINEVVMAYLSNTKEQIEELKLPTASLDYIELCGHLRTQIKKDLQVTYKGALSTIAPEYPTRLIRQLTTVYSIVKDSGLIKAKDIITKLLCDTVPLYRRLALELCIQEGKVTIDSYRERLGLWERMVRGLLWDLETLGILESYSGGKGGGRRWKIKEAHQEIVERLISAGDFGALKQVGRTDFSSSHES